MGYETISDYLKHLEKDAYEAVSDFVGFMGKEYPELSPKISYSMPMWWFGPKIYDGYVAVSAANKHFSVHFLEESFILMLKEELPECTFGKRCINIRYNDEHALIVVKQKVKDYINDKGK